MKKAEADDKAIVQLSVAELRSIIRSEVDAALAERAKTPALLTNKQMAEQLQITERSLLDLRKAGLPHQMMGDSPRYDLAVVLQWLQVREAVRAMLAKHDATSDLNLIMTAREMGPGAENSDAPASDRGVAGAKPKRRNERTDVKSS